MFNKLEHEEPPPPLGQYLEGWWDMRNDHGTLKYEFNGEFFVRPSGMRVPKKERKLGDGGRGAKLQRLKKR
jgi:hypothetical protein